MLTISIVTLSIPIVGGSAEPNIRAENVGQHFSVCRSDRRFWYAPDRVIFLSL